MSDGAAIAARFLLFIDLMLLFGLAAFARLSLSETERARLPLRPIAAALLAGGIAASFFGLAALAAQMSGATLAEVDRASIQAVLSGTAAGTAWIVRIAALIPLLALVPLRRWGSISALAAVALATLAWNGHGAMNDGAPGWIHLGADIVHLIAAAGWIGSLAGLLLLFAGSRLDADRRALTHRCLTGFSSAGTLLVAAIVATGLINLWFTVGPTRLTALPASAYGRWLIAKLMLFGAMLLLAGLNRFRLAPALGRVIAVGDSRRAWQALRISIAIEAACGIAVLAAVAWLGTLPPPVSEM